MKMYQIKDFLAGKANLSGMSLAAIVEMMQLFGFIDATAPIWAAAAYGLGFVLMHKPNDGKCPDDLDVLEKLEWAHLTFLRESDAQKTICSKVSAMALRLEGTYKQYDEVRLKDFAYAKAHSEVSGLITIYFVKAIEAYLNVPIVSMRVEQADAALETQLSLIGKLLDQLEEQLVKMPLSHMESATAQLEQLVQQKSQGL